MSITCVRRSRNWRRTRTRPARFGGGVRI